MRRAWTRYLLENGIQERPNRRSRESARVRSHKRERIFCGVGTLGRAAGNSETIFVSRQLRLYISANASRRRATLPRLLSRTDEAIRSGNIGQ